MGLDMYLSKKTYVKNWDHHPEWRRFEVTVIQGNEPYDNIKTERVKFVIEDVGYWRKANHIHKWFVDNVQNGEDDCREYYVSKEDLAALLEACYEVKNNPDEAHEILPIQEGYFFGDYDYNNQYYMDQVQHTINIIESLLKEFEVNGDSDIYYQSSW
jgi:hypothetical protein